MSYNYENDPHKIDGNVDLNTISTQSSKMEGIINLLEEIDVNLKASTKTATFSPPTKTKTKSPKPLFTKIAAQTLSADPSLTLQFNTKIVLKSTILHRAIELKFPSKTLHSHSEVNRPVPGVASVTGTGSGNPMECFELINPSSLVPQPPSQQNDNNSSEYANCAHFGDTVCLRLKGVPATRGANNTMIHSSHTNDRFLGVKMVSSQDVTVAGDGQSFDVLAPSWKVGFFRGLVGQGEKWIIRSGDDNAFPSPSPSSTALILSGSTIRLQSVSTGRFLTLSQSMLNPNGSLLDLTEFFSDIGLVDTTQLPQYSHSHSQDSNRGLNFDGEGDNDNDDYNDSSGLLDFDAGSSWEVVKANTPTTPRWNWDRPFLTGHGGECDENENEIENADPKANVKVKAKINPPPSLQKQENLLLNECLSAMMGFQGDFITSTTNSTNLTTKFSVNTTKFETETESESSLDSSLVYLCERILPICGKFVYCDRWCKLRYRYEFGSVSHALASAVNLLLKEYLIGVGQMESEMRQNKLSLQKLHLHVQPSLRTMTILVNFLQELKGAVGGEALNVLHNVIGRVGGERAASEASRERSEPATKKHWLL